MRHLIIYRRVNRPRRNDEHSSAGFTLIEVCIASALLILLTLALTQTVMVRMTSGELKARKQESRAVADNALEALAATSRAMLPDGVGSFTLAGDNSLNLTGACSVLVCPASRPPRSDASPTSSAR